MHGNGGHGNVHVLPMPCNFRPFSEKEAFPQEIVNANNKEIGDDLDIVL